MDRKQNWGKRYRKMMRKTKLRLLKKNKLKVELIPEMDLIFDDIKESRLTGCWLWMRHLTSDNYPQLNRNNEVEKLAHRYSYHFFKGPIPKGHWVTHTCKQRTCVNPTHLKLKTREEVLRAKDSGRSREKPLPEDVVKGIWSWRGIRAPKDVARSFGVKLPRVHGIWRGQTYTRWTTGDNAGK